MKTKITFVNVSKNYENDNTIIKVLNNINIKIKEEDFVVITGPSGSGKSTFLNLLSLTDFLSSGKIYYYDEEISNYSLSDREKFLKDVIGFVFQDSNLVNDLTVYENIMMGSLINKSLDINELLDVMCLEQIKNKYPNYLSGGQKQVVSIARALIKNPEILLLDEPTSSLDQISKEKVMNYLKLINKKYKTTIILVTHDESICKYANVNIVINNGDIVKQKRRKKDDVINN